MALITRTKVQKDCKIGACAEDWKCGRPQESVFVVLKNRSQKTSLKVLCQPVSGYDEFLFRFSFSFFFFFFFVIFAEYEILYNSCNCVWFFFCEFYRRGDYVGGPLQNSHQCSDWNKHTSVLLLARTFCPGHCFGKRFLFTGKRWKEIPFLPSLWDLFEQYRRC